MDEEEEEEWEADPRAEFLARLAMSVGLSIARAFHDGPEAIRDMAGKVAESRVLPASLREKAQVVAMEGVDVRAIAGFTVDYANGALSQGPRAEAMGAIVRLCTQFIGPIIGLSNDQVYNGMKAYTLIQKYCERAKPNKVPFGSAKPPLKELERYVRFAVAAYGTYGLRVLGLMESESMKDIDAIKILTNIEAEEAVLASEWRSDLVGDLYKPGYFVVKDDENAEIIVSVRGTYAVNDAVTDMMCEDADLTYEYHRKEDAEHAKEELHTVFNSLSTAIDGLRGRGESMTVAELKENLFETSDSLANQLKRWASVQHEMFRSNSAAFEEDENYDIDAFLNSDHRKVEGRAHVGFLNTAKYLAADLEDLLLDVCEEHPEYKLVICGHSLGASVAAIMTLLWSKIPPLADARCYAFATPACVSLDIAQAPATSRKITSVILGEDVITRLSLASCLDLRASVLTLATDPPPESFLEQKRKREEKKELEAKGSKTLTPARKTTTKPKRKGKAKEVNSLADWVIYKVALEKAKDNESSLEQEFAELFKVLQSDHMTHDKLYPPGRIWHIIDQEKGLAEGSLLKKPSEFDYLLLSSTMFTSHLPERYAYACDPSLPSPNRIKHLVKVPLKR